MAGNAPLSEQPSPAEAAKLVVPLTVGVLALQGSYPLHLRALERLGVGGRKVLRPEHLGGLDGLILPGGESTVMSRLALQYGLFERLQELGRKGLPMFGTCAGAILLGCGAGAPPRLGIAPVTLERNAYGRQTESFTAPLRWKAQEPLHGVFIRAPRIVETRGERGFSGDQTAPEILACHESDPVLVRCANVLLSTFHPELTDDLRVHRHFLGICRRARTDLRSDVGFSGYEY